MAMQVDGGALQEEVAGTRAKRAARARAAHWAAQIGLPANITQGLAWNALADAPAWTYAPRDERDHLAMLAGALVSATQMRLWIDGERIAQAVALLGDTCFEKVLASELGMQCRPPEMLDLIPLKQLLLENGATVLLASIADEGLRRAIGWQMRCCEFRIDHPDARAVLAAAMNLAKLSNEQTQVSTDDSQEKTA
jgi:hypothetical protein